MEHIIKFTAGHDCIKFECKYDSAGCCVPGQGGSHGKHGVNLLFVVKGAEGAVQFVVYTDWLPQFVEADRISYRYTQDWGGKFVLPADLGYHSKLPHYEGQNIVSQTCEYCDGLPCYYDGSSLNAVDAMYTLVNGGDEALWKFLEAYYECVFHGGVYPKAVEYPKPLRLKGGE